MRKDATSVAVVLSCRCGYVGETCGSPRRPCTRCVLRVAGLYYSGVNICIYILGSILEIFVVLELFSFFESLEAPCGALDLFFYIYCIYWCDCISSRTLAAYTQLFSRCSHRLVCMKAFQEAGGVYLCIHCFLHF